MLHRLTVEVVECHRPRIFVDELVQGSFTSFRHVHELEENNDTTKLVDTMVWESPWGIAGKLADRMIERRLRAIVHDRNDRLKEIAESTG
jgi:ligand-binding SRPBCC domain-containing protein